MKEVLIVVLMAASQTIATNPQFRNFPDLSEERTKLITGYRDAYVLAAFAQRLRATFPDIWDLYFPTDQQDDAMRVYESILPDPDATDVGGAALAQFRFDHNDFNKGTGENDICEQGGEGYTANDLDKDQKTNFADCHICDKALDDSDPEEPLFLSEIDCDSFFNDDTEKYQIMDEMNCLGAVILHEMTHFNAICGASFDQKTGKPEIMDPDNGDNYDSGASLVWDYQSPAYSPKATREFRQDEPDRCVKNAEQYVWLALESYFTVKCARDLDDNGQTRFEAPDE